jgi:hypothetical protein
MFVNLKTTERIQLSTVSITGWFGSDGPEEVFSYID